MSNLLFIDSFDHYSIPQGSRKWTTFSGTTTSIVSGRTGNALQGSALNMPSKTLGAEYTTLTAGVAYLTSGLANDIIRFANVDISLNFRIEHVGDGRLRLHIDTAVWSYSSPPSTFVMHTGRWYYVELQASVTGSPPHFVASARVNEDEILTLDQTASSGPAVKFASVGLGASGGFGSTVDDFYCTDTEYLGDVKIGVLYPNAIGDSSGWTPNVGGSPNFLNVLEHPADDDSTYVAAATVGLKDLYNLDDIGAGFTGVIKGAQALWLVRKSDAGAGAVKGVWKSGSTELTQTSGLNYFEPGGYYPSMLDYLYSIEPERKSLFTSSDWAVSEINSLQLGIKRTA